MEEDVAKYKIDAETALQKNEYNNAYTYYRLAFYKSKYTKFEFVPLIAKMYMLSKKAGNKPVLIRNETERFTDDGSSRKDYEQMTYERFVAVDSSNADVYLAMAALCLDATPDYKCHDIYYAKAMSLGNGSKECFEGLAALKETIKEKDKKKKEEAAVARLSGDLEKYWNENNEKLAFETVATMEKISTAASYGFYKLANYDAFNKHNETIRYADSLLRYNVIDSMSSYFYKASAYTKQNKLQEAENAKSYILDVKLKILFDRIKAESENYTGRKHDDFTKFFKSIELLEGQNNTEIKYMKMPYFDEFYSGIEKAEKLFKENHKYYALFTYLAIYHYYYNFNTDGLLHDYYHSKIISDHPEIKRLIGLLLYSFNNENLKNKASQYFIDVNYNYGKAITTDSSFYEMVKNSKTPINVLLEKQFASLVHKKNEWSFWAKEKTKINGILNEPDAMSRVKAFDAYMEVKKTIVNNLLNGLIQLDKDGNKFPSDTAKLIFKAYYFAKDFIIASQKGIKNGEFKPSMVATLELVNRDLELFKKDIIPLLYSQIDQDTGRGFVNKSLIAKELATKLREKFKGTWVY